MGLHGHRSELSAFLFLMMIFSLVPNTIRAQTYNDSDKTSSDASNLQSQQGYLDIVSNSEGYKQTLHIPSDQMLFDVTPIYDSQGNETSLSLYLRPGLDDFYHQVGLFDKPKDIVFIYPSFTQAAYGDHGFYNYYKKECDSSCLTVKIPNKVNGIQASSIVSAWVLKLLDYPYVKDEDVDKNPDILKQYKRVIVLHNEYVTKKEFDAITGHPDVIFLYPNALYAQVATNYENNTITLVRGHGYPSNAIKNGFGWRDDNSKYEYDVSCKDWNFYHKDNYTMINCYPEYKILTSNAMLESLQENEPTTLSDDVANWLIYPQDQNRTEKLLDDFGIAGTSIPTWVQKPALWLSNGGITKREFNDMMQYLYQKQIIK
ncbi:MAG: hypothetical protein KGI11_02730 [Thaumarchaeota archaeon]|nr:hypothetical protein [Nitrososphaerota archaeon]